ncbi:hypothetical protein [Stutzerimonas balearica]|uniref:hypothetical protein n=1 Tax=Stutzerimonas balearica TaxID=74829 RepID=UPI0026864153
MNVDYFKKKEKTHILAKVDTLGMYDFHTSTIYLGAVRSAQINALTASAENPIKVLGEASLTFDQYSLLSSIFPLVTHECTHFIDATSTLWGLSHLQKMAMAYTSSVEYGGREHDFVKAKIFHTHLRCLRLPKYYTVVNNEIECTTQWRRPQITGGIVFSGNGSISEKPILFARFSNREGVFLARSPISLVSLLEASAMAQEIFNKMALIDRLSEDHKVIEAASYSKRTIGYLYNHEITEYSVCVHLVANHIECADVIFAFYVTAALVRTALNFPRKAFDRAIEYCDFEVLFGAPVEHGFIGRLVEGLKIQDPCILFFILCNALNKDIEYSAGKIKEAIIVALSTLGIQEHELEQWILEEAKNLSDEICISQSNSVALLARVGWNNMNEIKNISSVLPWHKLQLPPLLLEDLTKWTPFGSAANEFSKIDFETFFEEMVEGEKWVNNFSEGCL